VSDYLVRVLAKDANIRALACVTTELVADASRRHGTLPTASAALGRALTGAALFGALLKTGQRVALKFEGNGPLGKILTEADSNGVVRGGVGNPEVNLIRADGKLDVAGALGRVGLLTVTRDLGLKEPYRGTVPLYTGEIAEDLAWYMTESEQIPSAVGLGVFVDPDGSIAASGGFLIQSMPPQDDLLIDRLMARIEGMPPVTDFIRRGTTPEGLMEYLFDGIPFTVLEKRVLAFVCSCSRERIERVLLSLGRKDLGELIARQGGTSVTCEFCREEYRFSREELERLFRELESGTRSDQR
jgi:molecular chaperone Hsp33